MTDLVHDILELHDGDTDETVLPAEAVILHADVQLVRRDLVLVSDYTEQKKVLMVLILPKKIYFIFYYINIARKKNNLSF